MGFLQGFQGRAPAGRWPPPPAAAAASARRPPCQPTQPQATTAMTRSGPTARWRQKLGPACAEARGAAQEHKGAGQDAQHSSDTRRTFAHTQEV